MGTETTPRTPAGKKDRHIATLLNTAANDKAGFSGANRDYEFFDPSQISKFQEGILKRDFIAVSRALDAGVDPNTPAKGDHHPLYALLHGMAQQSKETKRVTNPTFPMGMTPEQVDAETTRIVDLLLKKGARLAERQEHVTRFADYLADQLLTSHRLADLSNVIIHTIDETVRGGRDPYVPELARYVDNYVTRAALRAQDGIDDAEVTAAALRHFKTVHDLVRKRLQSPKTFAEWNLAENHLDKISFWTDEFKAPPMQLFMGDVRKAIAEVFGDGDFLDDGEGENPLAALNKAQNDKYDMSKFITILPKRKPEEVLADIDRLVGLNNYKEMIASDGQLRLYTEACQREGIEVDEPEVAHMVLTGNTGTGKTTLARLDAEYRHALGLTGPKFAEVSRTKLMKDHIGGTDMLIQKIIDEADNIFIDEAPALIAANGSDGDKRDFGNRVMEAVIPATENLRHSKTFYFAGYTEEMNKFLDSDSGMRNRIGRFVHIPDPTMAELAEAMVSRLAGSDPENPKRTIDADALEAVLKNLEKGKADIGERFFGNFRIARKIVEKLPRIMAKRLFPKDGLTGAFNAKAASREDLQRVTLEDIWAIDFKEMLGLEAREALKKTGARESGYGETRIGFTANIR